MLSLNVLKNAGKDEHSGSKEDLKTTTETAAAAAAFADKLGKGVDPLANTSKTSQFRWARSRFSSNARATSPRGLTPCSTNGRTPNHCSRKVALAHNTCFSVLLYLPARSALISHSVSAN